MCKYIEQYYGANDIQIVFSHFLFLFRKGLKLFDL